MIKQEGGQSIWESEYTPVGAVQQPRHQIIYRVINLELSTSGKYGVDFYIKWDEGDNEEKVASSYFLVKESS